MSADPTRMTAKRAVHSRKIDRISWTMIAFQIVMTVALWEPFGAWVAVAGFSASALLLLGVAQVIEAIREAVS